jgi:hypothetical protein
VEKLGQSGQEALMGFRAWLSTGDLGAVNDLEVIVYFIGVLIGSKMLY